MIKMTSRRNTLFQLISASYLIALSSFFFSPSICAHPTIEEELRYAIGQRDRLADPGSAAMGSGPPEELKRILTYIDFLNQMHTVSRSPSPALTLPEFGLGGGSPTCGGAPPRLSISPGPGGLTPLRLSPVSSSPVSGLSIRGSRDGSPTLSRVEAPSPDFFILTPDKKEKILALIDIISHRYHDAISGEQIYNLYQSIEELKLHGRPGETASVEIGIPAAAGGGHTHRIQIHHGNDHSVFLQLESDPLCSGAAKALYEVTSYGTWAKLALLAPLHGARGPLIKEQRVLSAIHAAKVADPALGEGLVETVEIVGASEPGTTPMNLQKIYERDLLSHIQSHPPHSSGQMSESNWLLLDGASHGLRNLHHLGYVHGDIKPENILLGHAPVAGGGMKLKAVVSDFDTTFLPRDFIAAERERDKSRYTLSYSPPEVLEFIASERDSLWIGDSVAKKVENAQKSDVYALGTVAQLLRRGPAGTPWAFPPVAGGVAACGPDSFHDPEEFLPCQKWHLTHHQLTQAQSSDYDSLDHLIAKSIESDPQERPTAEEFYQGVRYAQSKIKFNPTLSTLTAEEYGALYPRSATISERSLTPEEIHHALHGKPKKSYLLSPEVLPGGTIALRLSYIGVAIEGLATPVRSKLLDLNPKDPASVGRELEFLRRTHIIQ